MRIPFIGACRDSYRIPSFFLLIRFAFVSTFNTCTVLIIPRVCFARLINYNLQNDNLLTMIFHTQELESGATVIGRGLMVMRATERNEYGKYVPLVDGSKTLDFSQKMSSFEDVRDIHELCSKFP